MSASSPVLRLFGQPPLASAPDFVLPDDLYRTVLDRLDRALDLDGEAARRAFVDAQTDLSDAARAELAALLDVATAPDARLDGPAQRLLDDDLLDAMPLPGGTSTRYGTFGDDAGPLSGQTLGPWRLGRRLGAGGMGVVYDAQRNDGLYDQRAAAKVMRHDVFGDDLAARFDRERRVLAQLDHPALTRLLDGGRTDDGRPYFVMEYVDGTPLVEALADAPIERRLDAFAHACDAVAHAHRALVVHRDLKPAHVVATAGGSVRVLDFGIARLLDGADDVPDVTRPGGSTPHTRAYAAPEQFRSEPATTATDVYALGLILYELLTGQRAFGLDRTDHADVPCPSDAPGLSRQLRRHLRGDLDAIVQRATCPEPRDRYASAADLADDVRRVADHRPVEARHATLGYRLRRFARRRRAALVVTAAVVAVATVAGAVAWNRHAEASAAEARAARAATYLSTLLAAASPYVEDSLTASAETTMGDFLGIAARRARRDLAGDPAALAAVLAGIGKALFDFERFPDAAAALVDAVALHDRSGTGATPEAMDALHTLVRTRAHQSRHTDADVEAARYLARVRSLPEDTARVRALLVSADHLRHPDSARVRRAEARALLARLGTPPSTLHEDLVHAEIQDAAYDGDGVRRVALTAEAARLLAVRRGPTHPLTAVAEANHAIALSSAERYAEAVARFDAAIPHLDAASGPDSDNALAARNARANALSAMGRTDEAIAQLRDLIVRHSQRRGGSAEDVATAQQNLGVALAHAGRFAEAATACRTAARLYADALPTDDPHRYYPLITLARLERLSGDPRAAETMARRALDGLTPLLPAAHPAPVTARLHLGLAVAAQGRRAEARPLLVQARAALLALLPPDRAGADEADAALQALSGF